MYQAIFKDNNYTVFYDYSETRDFDMSYGNIDIPSLENNEYIQFFNDVNAALNKGPFIISIYQDVSGTIFVKDDNGNDINLRLVKSNSYTYPFIDKDANYIDGIFYFVFDDGGTFNHLDLDANDHHYYYIQGISDMNNLHQLT